MTTERVLVVIFWQARQDLNPQPAVLETAALPIELLAYNVRRNSVTFGHFQIIQLDRSHDARMVKDGYWMISVMAPAATVRPPSRMAKRLPVSSATGAINSTSIVTLSPGITISTPAGRSIEPVMSIVRM